MRSGKGRWGTTQGKGGRWLAGEPTNRPMATQAGEPDSVGVGTITRLPSDSLPGSIAQIRGPGQVHEEEELLFADEGGPFAFNTEDIVSFKVGSRQGSRWASNLSLWQEHIDGRLPSGPASTAAAAASTATTAAAAPVVMAAAGAAAAAAAAAAAVAGSTSAATSSKRPGRGAGASFLDGGMTDAQAAASSVVTEDKLCFECSEQAPEKRSYKIGEGRCDTCGIEDGEIFAMQDGWRASLQPSSRDWLRPDATSSSRMPRGGQGTSVSSSSVASTAPARPGPQRLSLAAAVSVEVEADGRLTADASDRALPLAAQQLLQMTKVRTTPSHHGIVKRVDQHYAFVACQEIHNMYHRDVFVPAREMTGKKLSVGDRVLFSVNILTADNIQAVDLSRDDEAMTTRARLGSDDAGGDLSDQRFTGSIKSFNSESGYGFVTSPETTQLYGCDVFLHGSQIKEFNIGDRVMFTVRLNNKTMKPQAYDLRAAGPANVRSWLDSSGDTGEAAATTASSPGAEPSGEQALAIGSGTSSATPAAAIASADISEERYVGDIKSFNSQKGYGFIECAELFKQFQRDVFIHMNQFEGKKIGDHVTFKIQVKKGQPQAAEVSLADVNGQPLEAPGKSTAPQGKAQAGGVTGTTAAAAAGSALGSVAAAVRRAEEAQREVEEAAAMLSSRLIRACASVRLEACDIIRDLLAAKAQPNVKDVTGQTPLMIAALNARQSERKCKLLIEYRADLESPLCAGMSAIEWAKQRLNPNFAAFLEAERIGKPLENYEVAMTAPRDDF